MTYKIPSDMIEDRATGVSVASQLADMTTVKVNVESYKIQVPEVDDTARIQRAIDFIKNSINTKGTVEFAQKRYDISSHITTYSDIHLKGNRTTIYNNNLSDDAIYANNGAGHVKISGLIIVGDSTGRISGQGIKLSSGSTNVVATIEDVITQYHENGVYIESAILTVLKNVWSYNNLKNGFSVVDGGIGGTSVKFIQCYASSNGENGFKLESHNYSSFDTCGADHNGLDGYFVNGINELGVNEPSVGISFTSCGAEQNTRKGFNLRNVWGFSIKSCAVIQDTTVGEDHYYFDGSRYGEISGVYGRPSKTGFYTLNASDMGGSQLPTNIIINGCLFPSKNNINSCFQVPSTTAL